MAGVTTAQRVSYADLESWPDDGRRYELYDGEVSVIPSPLPLHQVVSARLYLALESYVRVHGGIVLYAPLDIVLTDFDVVQPDLLLFAAERAHLIQLRQVTRHAPDLAIEIMSPSTAGTDRGRKRALLARHCVREYWLVDPQVPQIEVYSLAEDRLVLSSLATAGNPVRSPVLSALALRPADLIPPSAATA
jgi:Uma2 family endonuclease